MSRSASPPAIYGRRPRYFDIEPSIEFSGQKAAAFQRAWRRRQRVTASTTYLKMLHAIVSISAPRKMLIMITFDITTTPHRFFIGLKDEMTPRGQ